MPSRLRLAFGNADLTSARNASTSRSMMDAAPTSGGAFFFSSRRRHTRFGCDWSSDVCSSDLDLEVSAFGCTELLDVRGDIRCAPSSTLLVQALLLVDGLTSRLSEGIDSSLHVARSEERRVGKERRSRRRADRQKNNRAVSRLP